MKQLHIDNHYVPQLYLKQWAQNGKIPTYRLLVPDDKVPVWKSHSTRGIAFHQHLYTYVAGQGETDEFECWLNREFESPAEEAIHRAINEQRMSPEHWRHLTRFALSQDVRTPARLREFLTKQRGSLQILLDETITESVAKLEAGALAGARLPKAAPDRANLFPLKVTIEHSAGEATLKAQATVGRRLWLWNVRHLLTSTINRLPPYRWTILKAPEGVSWPTTDNPLVRLNFHNINQYDFGGGWGVRNGDIFIPLSPQYLLFTCIGRRSWPRGTTLDKGLALLIRKMIVEHADRYVFSQDTSDIELIRPRTVCRQTYGRELLAWKTWHKEQCQAESDLLS